MQAFDILIRSFQDVQDFVSLAMVQPFEIQVGSGEKLVSGKSYFGIFSLDCSHPLHVSMECTQEEFLQFRQQAARFLA